MKQFCNFWFKARLKKTHSNNQTLAAPMVPVVELDLPAQITAPMKDKPTAQG